MESIDNIIDLAAERARRAPPSPPPLAPEAHDFRVMARDAQGKLKLVTGAGAFDDFEEAAAFAVTSPCAPATGKRCDERRAKARRHPKRDDGPKPSHMAAPFRGG